jgi:O-antigen/teichoic acid export membrane protein
MTKQKNEIDGCICKKDKAISISRKRVLIGLAFTTLLILLFVFDRELWWLYVLIVAALVASMAMSIVYYYFMQRKRGHETYCSLRFASILSLSILPSKNEWKYINSAK